MTKQPATPLPWRVVEERGNRPAIYINGPKGEAGTLGARSLAKLYNLTGWQQDAAYIVHAANAYGPLVEALKAVLTSNEDDVAQSASALLRSLGEAE